MTGRRLQRKLLFTAAGVAVVICTAFAILKLRDFLGAPQEAPKQTVQEIRIVRPPPPPPDVEPPPPPPPEERVDVPEPIPNEVESSEPPPGEQLGVDAEGAGAGDSFGLVGRPGGRDLLATGGSALAWYAGIVKNEILSRLEDDQKIRSGSYSVVVRLWVKPDGTVERANLASSTGDRERDRAFERVLSQMSRLSRGPPADTPLPITLRIVSRA